ncbi:MAG: RNA polymerase sigma factor RpoD/SigA, partial [Bacteroidota bacterium]
MRALTINQSITRRDEKSIERYLTEIGRYDVLSPEEEIDLFKRFQAGDKSALEKIVNHNLRFVVSVAKQYHFPGLSLGDLINEGNIGLITAAERFDISKGFKFISYAVWWIRQSIIKHITDKGRKIRLPSNFQSTNNKVMDAWRSFLQTEQRAPSIEELAEMTDLSERMIRSSLEHYKKASSLDAPVGDDGDSTFIDLMKDESIDAPDHKLTVEDSQRQEVRYLLSKLPRREAKILRLYYGINLPRPVSLDDISDKLGVSRERIRQIRDRALNILRKRHQDFEVTFSDN